ncbi:MAG: hypothetical protein AB1630_06565 [bacterium]
MKLKEELKNKTFFFLLIPFLVYSKIDLFSLKEKEEVVKPEIIEEIPIVKETEKGRRGEGEKRRGRIVKPKKEPKLEPIPKEEISTEPSQIQEETMPFETFGPLQTEEKKRPLWIIFSLAITSIAGLLIIFLIIIHLMKRERRIQKPLFHIPPSDIEDEIKNLKQSSKIVSSQISEIERMLPGEFIEGLRSGKVFSQIAKDVSSSLEPRIRELGLAYQGIKKSIAQLDVEINNLSSLKGLNFKDLARQTATEFIMPLQNEFNKHKLSYENMLSSFEERQDGRLSTIEKRHREVKELVDEVHKRLVGLESLITSATMFEQEPVIRTKKREEIPPLASKTTREEINKLIYELADNGLSVEEIAKKTKIGKGEIELILSFRNKR